MFKYSICSLRGKATAAAHSFKASTHHMMHPHHTACMSMRDRGDNGDHGDNNGDGLCNSTGPNGKALLQTSNFKLHLITWLTFSSFIHIVELFRILLSFRVRPVHNHQFAKIANLTVYSLLYHDAVVCSCLLFSSDLYHTYPIVHQKRRLEHLHHRYDGQLNDLCNLFYSLL